MVSQKINFTLNSVQPLLMHNPQGVNPMHPLSKEKKGLTAKRTKKTDEDLERILQIDWELGLYYDPDVGVCIPSNCVEAMLRNAFQTIRKGKDVVSSTVVTPTNIPLKFAGNDNGKKLTITDLKKNMLAYSDVRNAKLKGSTSIIVCRPRFNKWEITFDVDYDDEVFNRDEIIQFMQYAGLKVGLCDYRPKYGTFTVRVNN